jgi:non-heme chloroperoxidase
VVDDADSARALLTPTCIAPDTSRLLNTRGAVMPYVTTSDQTVIYYKDWGRGRPVVLIHGWPLSADSWDDQAFALVNAGFRVVSYDRRGFGRSSQPWTGYDYDTLASDLDAVMKAAQLTDATIIGFSMGGGEVARYMSKYQGANILQAGLISSIVPYMLKTPDNPDGTPKEKFDEIAAGIKKDRAAFFTSFFKTFYGVGMVSHPVSDEVLHASWNVAMQSALRPTLACAEAFGTTDLRPDMAAFNVPTLIIHGTADKTVPIDPAGRAAARGIKNSTLIEYDGSPHGLLATDKQRVIDDLLAFLKG